MKDLPSTERTLTQLDYVRLTRLCTLGGAKSPAHETMLELLQSSDLVASPAIPPTVVTMYSQVLVEDAADGSRLKLTLCYPDDAEPSAGFISVLSPAGLSLLGLQCGQTATWEVPPAGRRNARVVQILFQPEATGDYTT